ncbi:MAG: GNAT family N-acetyltransferase [Phycisphaerales bacterium]|nr:GNAT family N-acetyltransferase [Phycisphaerales bacterium]MCB9862468.1 GNAT family N-acetyltransferase [Phycisphaerales bacterium]
MSISSVETGDRLLASARERWHDKFVSPEEAISKIRRGDRILLGSGSVAPVGLLPYLVSEKAEAGNCEILHLLTLGPAPYAAPEFERRFRHNALFIGPNVRRAVAEGRADYTPVFLSEIPPMIRNRQIPIDVFIVSVAPPDENGYCNLGSHVDIAPAGIDAASVVICEVNPCMPRTFGETRVHVDRIDCLVEMKHEVPELKSPPLRDESIAIARNVARLVMDGATIQVGIGALPDAILRELKDHRDLGVHTEMFTDGIVDLARSGVVNGSKKSHHQGKIVASIVMGTRKVYDFIHENPDVELYPVDYVNDPFNIAKHDYMTAINTAIEVDLTGQVCADSIGDRFYSGIGGQVDFIRGSARARYGRPIICLPSTARNGNVSRIKPMLTDGAGVVTTRGDVHFVVTEYGIAYLHGKSVRERAMALIQIAHPKYRSWLLAEAKNRHYVYQDQPEPVVVQALYPAKYEWSHVTKQGIQYRIRPIKSTDEAMLAPMFYKFSREELYRRFFGNEGVLPDRSIQDFCTIDYKETMTLIGTYREDVVTRVIGLALYTRIGAPGEAKAGVIVTSDQQGQGVAVALAQRLCEVAREAGVSTLRLDIHEADEQKVRRLFAPHARGCELMREGEHQVLRVDL